MAIMSEDVRLLMLLTSLPISTQHDSEASAEENIWKLWVDGGFIICTLHQICLELKVDNIGDRCNTTGRERPSNILAVNLKGVNFGFYTPL